MNEYEKSPIGEQDSLVQNDSHFDSTSGTAALPPSDADSRHAQQQAANNSPHVLQLKALQAGADAQGGSYRTASPPPLFAGPSPVQRQVKRVEDSDVEGAPMYFSSLDPDQTPFETEEHANDLDRVLKEYAEMLVEIEKPMAQIGKDSLGRMQRVKRKDFNSWVPKHCREVREVVRLHDQLTRKMQARNFTQPDKVIYTMKDKDFEKWTETLLKEGFSGAEGVMKDIRTTKGASSSGYKLQLLHHMRSRSEFTLTEIEPTFGPVNPITNQQHRGDESNVYAHTQDTQEHFYEKEEEEKEEYVTDVKLGYKDEKYQGGLKKQAEYYWKNLPKGTGLEYYWYNDQVPPAANGTLTNTFGESRKKDPKSFSGGARLGKEQVLDPVPPSPKKKANALEPPVEKSLFGNPNLNLPLGETKKRRAEEEKAKPLGIQHAESEEEELYGKLKTAKFEEEPPKKAPKMSVEEKKSRAILKRINGILFDKGIYEQAGEVYSGEGSFREWLNRLLEQVRGWADRSDIADLL